MQRGRDLTWCGGYATSTLPAPMSRRRWRGWSHWSERLLELLGRPKADGPRFAELHQLVGFRVADSARLPGTKRPGSKSRVAEAALILDSPTDVIKNGINNPCGGFDPLRERTRENSISCETFLIQNFRRCLEQR